MRLSAFIFDLDGTLADTLPVCIKAYQETVQAFCHRSIPEAEIIAGFGPDDEGMLEHLIPGQLEHTLPFYLQSYQRLHLELCRELFPGIPDLFRALKSKGLRTAIVSGKGAFSAKISLQILGLDKWVDRVETGFAAGPDKPRSLRRVLEFWQLPAEACAYVGDVPYDMWAARQVGMLPLGAGWAETSALANGNENNGAQVFRSVESLIDWIEKQDFLA